MKAVMTEYSINHDSRGVEEIRFTMRNFGDPKEMANFLYFIASKENIFSDDTLAQYLMTRKMSE